MGIRLGEGAVFDMRRREFVSLLGAAVLWLPAARAQQQPRVWRVGYLTPSATMDTASRTLFEAFRLKLRELGYIEGQNLILDVRRAEGDFSRLPSLAAELVSLRPDVIVAATTPSILAVQQATLSIPVVMSPATDPVGSGFVNSLAKPGGNITGVSNMTTDLTAKSLELLHTLVPNAKRIAALMSANPIHRSQIKEVHVAAQALSLTVVPVTAAVSADLDNAFATMAREDCDGLVVLADPRIIARIPDLAAKGRLPAIYQLGDFVHFGGLLSYGPNFSDLFRRVAIYVDKILKGSKPAELPVEQPVKFELLINLRTAKALGLDVPPTLLAIADEVIE
jgi:putative ABC transport system substrate-binding protein